MRINARRTGFWLILAILIVVIPTMVFVVIRRRQFNRPIYELQHNRAMYEALTHIIRKESIPIETEADFELIKNNGHFSLVRLTRNAGFEVRVIELIEKWKLVTAKRTSTGTLIIQIPINRWLDMGFGLVYCSDAISRDALVREIGHQTRLIESPWWIYEVALGN